MMVLTFKKTWFSFSLYVVLSKTCFRCRVRFKKGAKHQIFSIFIKNWY